MPEKVILLTLLLLSAGLEVFLVAGALLRTRAGSKTFAFAGLCAAGLVYSLGYMLELTSPDLAATLTAVRVEYVGIAFIPVLLLLVVRDFNVGGRVWIPTPLFYIVPVITLFLVLTMERHEMYYLNPGIRFQNGLTLFTYDRSLGYWVFQGYKICALAYSTFVFARRSVMGPRNSRIQARYMLVGVLIPWVGNFFYIARAVPLGLDPSPLVLSITAALFAIGFFRYRFLDIRPVARETVFEQMRDAVLVTDAEGNIIDHNAAANVIFPSVLGPTAVQNIRDMGSSSSSLLPMATDGAADRSITISLPEGTRRFDLHRSELSNRSGKVLGMAYVLMDVTERSKMEERLHSLASTDELTGVANRRRFFDRARAELERAQRYGRPFGVAVLDLNDFKEINDRYGHHAGDETLRLTARLCSETLRSADIMGRFGGDEFAFAFPECGESDCREAAERLAHILSLAALPYGNALIHFTASIGVAGASVPPLPDLEELLRLADERMYKIKGRDIISPE